MDYLIAPTLFQNKTCRLPGIGVFTVISNNAKIDSHDKLITAPVPSIVFTALRDDKNGFNEFTALSELIKKDLYVVGKVNLKGIGDFVKNEDGTIGFIPLQLSRHFTPPVVAELAIHEDATYSRLVGDRETSDIALPGSLAEDEIVKDRWWIWAIILGAIGAGILIYYIAQNGLDILGNAIKI